MNSAKYAANKQFLFKLAMCGAGPMHSRILVEFLNFWVWVANGRVKTNHIFKNLEWFDVSAKWDALLFFFFFCFVNVFKILTAVLVFLISALSHPGVLGECVKIVCLQWCTFCDVPGEYSRGKVGQVHAKIPSLTEDHLLNMLEDAFSHVAS